VTIDETGKRPLVYYTKCVLWRCELRYRSAVLVYHEILTALASGPLGPTKLARRVNVPYDRLSGYTDVLLKNGVIVAEAHEDHQEYHLTPAGAETLADLQRALSKLSL
jgi:predicted transcriptional regulator